MSIGGLHGVQKPHLTKGKILNTQYTAIQLCNSPIQQCAVHAGRETATLINMRFKHLHITHTHTHTHTYIYIYIYIYIVWFVCFCFIL